LYKGPNVGKKEEKKFDDVQRKSKKIDEFLKAVLVIGE